MFTGIVEAQGRIMGLEKDGQGLTVTVKSPISSELKPGESLSHDGVCLTILSTLEDTHRVGIVEETLSKSTLSALALSPRIINLERSLKLGDRVSGHWVLGHVDVTAQLERLESSDNKSWVMKFRLPGSTHLLAEKGNIAVNGISLTCYQVGPDHFTVSVVPHTYDHTNLRKLKIDDRVNLEFDIIAKYLSKQTAQGRPSPQD